MYDYARYCVCYDEPAIIGMADLQGQETTSYPVDVFNVEQELIGRATSRDQYISVWNSDEDNQEVGKLAKGKGNFSFKLKLNPGQTEPDYVYGVPLIPGQQTGIYATEYSDPEYE